MARVQQSSILGMPRGGESSAPGIAHQRLHLQGRSESSTGLPHSSTLGVSIISNSQLLREGVMILLAEYLDIYLISSHRGDDTPSASSLPVAPGQIALIDSGVGRDSAIAWTLSWQQLTPPVKVVVLELDHQQDAILDCIEAGASGYVLQGASAAEVADTIMLVHQGKAICSPEITAKVFTRLAALKARASVAPTQTLPLTHREMEVLHLVARGYTDKEISAQLVIEPRTVKHHVHNILGKLNLRRRWEAARLAIESGWLEPALLPGPR